MTGTGGLRRRRLLLAASASSAVVVGHLLDALALLPGVHESSAVRAAALAPSYDVLTVAGAALLACIAEALLLRRHVGLAVVALTGGQLGLLALPEALGRAEAHGQGEQWGALVVAVSVQVLLAVGAVGAALLVDLLLLRLPRRLEYVAVAAAGVPGSRVSRLHGGRVVGGVRGRGPPVPAVL